MPLKQPWIKKLELPQQSLSSLVLFTEYRVGSLALALSLCSSITTLDVKIPKELTDHELQALPHLKNLSIFRLIANAENTASTAPLAPSVCPVNDLVELSLGILSLKID